MLPFDPSPTSGSARPPAPDHLAPLTERVVRGLGRLVGDPGLAAADRIRLEADHRFLSALDLDDIGATAEALVAYLPRVISGVEAVIPLYLRLQRDLQSLSACANGVVAVGGLADRPVPVGVPPPAALDHEDGLDGVGADTVAVDPHRGLGAEGRRGSAAGWSRSRTLALRLLFGVGALLVPLVVLASRALAHSEVGASVVLVAALGVVAAAAGLLARAAVVPGVLPYWLLARIEPPTTPLGARAADAARAVWRAEPPVQSMVES